MTVRYLVGALLLAVGVGLPVAAISGSGLPWEFRERAAVVLERVGTVENQTAPGEVHRVEKGEALMAGHEIRVGGLSQVRFRTRTRGEVTVGDASRVTVLDDSVQLGRGLAEVVVPPGATQRVSLPLLGCEVDLLEGQHLLLADGRDRLSMLVERGSASVRFGDGEPKVGQAGQLLSVLRGKEATWGRRMTSLTCSAECSRAQGNVRVKGAADPGSQVDRKSVV